MAVEFKNIKRRASDLFSALFSGLLPRQGGLHDEGSTQDYFKDGYTRNPGSRIYKNNRGMLHEFLEKSKVQALIDTTVNTSFASLLASTTGIIYRGLWNNTTNYQQNDLVTYGSSLLLAVVDVPAGQGDPSLIPTSWGLVLAGPNTTNLNGLAIVNTEVTLRSALKNASIHTIIITDSIYLTVTPYEMNETQVGASNKSVLGFAHRLIAQNNISFFQTNTSSGADFFLSFFCEVNLASGGIALDATSGSIKFRTLLSTASSGTITFTNMDAASRYEYVSAPSITWAGLPTQEFWDNTNKNTGGGSSSGIYQIYTWAEYVAALSDAVNHKSLYIRENIFAPSTSQQDLYIYGVNDVIVYAGSQIWANTPDDPGTRTLKYLSVASAPSFSGINFLGNLITYVGWDFLFIVDVTIKSERIYSSQVVDVQLSQGAEARDPLFQYEWQDTNFVPSGPGVAWFVRQTWTTPTQKFSSDGKYISPLDAVLTDKGEQKYIGINSISDLPSSGRMTTAEITTLGGLSVSNNADFAALTKARDYVGRNVFSTSTLTTVSWVVSDDIFLMGGGVGPAASADSYCSLFMGPAINQTITLSGSGDVYVKTLCLNPVAGNTITFTGTRKIYYEKLINESGDYDNTAGVLVQKFWLNSNNNKPNLVVQTTAATLNPNSDTESMTCIDNLATTCSITAPTGTNRNGRKFIYRFRSTTTQTLSWNPANFSLMGTTYPTILSANKTIYVGCIFSAFTLTWDIVSVVEET